MNENVDERTVRGFGEEWSRFDQRGASDEELRKAFDSYFAIFPWSKLPEDARGIDVGCGTGRWARRVAPRVGHITCVDASSAALEVARENLRVIQNAAFVEASVGNLPFSDERFDFGYSLGVLHHVPDTLGGLRECVRVLRPGAPFLLYLYYALENRPRWYRTVWKASDAARRLIARLPQRARLTVADGLAAGVYWPLARAAKIAEQAGFDVTLLPLAAYRHHTFYIMRNDALDRFGTSLEKRFTREQIATMMTDAGLAEISFHDGVPYWCAVGYKV